jgi:hypothetical protein
MTEQINLNEHEKVTLSDIILLSGFNILDNLN